MDDLNYIYEMRCNEDQRFLYDVIEIDYNGLVGYSKPWSSPTNVMSTFDFFDIPMGKQPLDDGKVLRANQLMYEDVVDGFCIPSNMAFKDDLLCTREYDAIEVPDSKKHTLTFGDNTGSISTGCDCVLCHKLTTLL